MRSIGEALKTTGAEDDLQIILRVLEDKSLGFKRQEAATGPFANIDTAVLTGLNMRMLGAIKRAQQQQGHPGRLSAPIVDIPSTWRVTLHLAFEQSHCRLSALRVCC